MASFPVLLDEMVVTAGKIAQPIQDQAVQATVHSAGDLNRARTTGIEGLAQRTPSLSYVHTGAAGEAPVILRGVGNYGFGEPSVGFFMDGVYLGSAYSYINGEMFDLDRAEVLHGPQTTVFGKSAVAGAINLVPRAPTTKPEGRAVYSLGENGRHKGLASVSGPITGPDHLARLSVAFQEFDGYYRNFNGQPIDADQAVNARLATTHWAGESIRISPSVSFGRRNQTPYPYRKVANPRDYGGLPPERNDPNDGDFGATNAALKIEKFDGDRAAFTSVTALNRNREQYGADIDYSRNATLYTRRDIERDDFQQEFRLAGGGEKGSWLGGLYYFHQRDDYVNDVTSGKWGGSLGHTDALTFKRTTSAYVQGDRKLFDPLVLGGGLRYDIDQREQNGTAGHKGRIFRHLSPNVSLSWLFEADKRAYVSYAQGHKAGGHNPGNYPSFGTERADTYELGAKTRWGRDLTVNGALFWTDVKGQQIDEFDAATNSEYTINVGRAHIRGAEGQVAWRLDGAWTLSGGATLMDARYGSFMIPKTRPDGSNGAVSFKDNKLHTIPNYKATLAADYARKVDDWRGQAVTALGRIEMVAYGEQYWDEFNTASQDPYQVVNLSLGFQVGGWRLRGYVDNLFDAGYFTNYVPAYKFTPAGSAVAVRGQERRFGLELSMEF